MASGDIDSSHIQRIIPTDVECSCAKTETSSQTQSVNPQLRTNTSKSEHTEDYNNVPTCDSISGQRRDVKYCKFQKYDFDHDDKFQEGWKQLEQSEQLCLRAKLFYYSKHFEPVKYEEYMKWKKETDVVIDAQIYSDTCATEPPSKGDNSCSLAAQEEPPISGQEFDSVSLTFSELAELVQSGQSIPGLKTVDVQPSDADPSPSLLQRKSKPWEN